MSKKANRREQAPKRFVRANRGIFIQDQKRQVFDPSPKRQRTRNAAVAAALQDWEREQEEDMELDEFFSKEYNDDF